MQISMTLSSVVALFGTMLVLAFIPSVSAMTVAIRSATFGFTHGLFVSLGIVAGDIIFIVIAIYGLVLLADLLGGQFNTVKLLGGACLIWLGAVLWRSRSHIEGVQVKSGSSLLSSFLSGLLITLGDQKAVLFYLGFFPAFVDLSAVTLADTGIIIVIAAVAVGGAKLAYACMADRAGLVLRDRGIYKGMNTVAGLILIGVGISLIARGLSPG